ncbi:alpha/beta fold hydrolase [Thermopolyspora sp. NPDC052614]|uniref:alpha/beta fold hydrolase n=1 Tax=Thermopolyspora sp. NPDC052614 TaxID=3155682 RepID=UPI003438F9A7
MEMEHSRRTALKLSAMAGGVAATGVAATGGVATRTARRPVTTFVFVVGASGGAGAGGYYELMLRGHRAVAVELPGHDPVGQYHRAYQAPQDLAALASAPSPMKGIGLDDYVDAAVTTIRRAAKNGPVVAVGGSMGGVTLSRTANEVPDLIDHLVYDSAFCCVDLRSAVDYLATPEGRTSLLLDPALATGVVGDPARLGAVRFNWRTADPKFLAAVRAANIAEDGPQGERELMAMLNGLLPDESLTVSSEDGRGHKETWGRVPRTYIRHTLDTSIPLALQNRMIREADRLTPRNRFAVRDVRTGHYATGDGWRQIIDILHGLAPR